MRQYAIKTEARERDASFLELLEEQEEGFKVRIVHRHPDWEDVQEDFISRELLNTCIRTGYLAEMQAQAV